MEAFLPNSRPSTGVVTARRQHETTALRDDTTAVCDCVFVQKRAICAAVWRGRKGRELNNKTGSQNVCKSRRQKCQINFVVFVSDFRLMPSGSCDAVLCERATFR